MESQRRKQTRSDKESIAGIDAERKIDMDTKREIK